jgi:electron transfer flavoprotein beta subunit
MKILVPIKRVPDPTQKVKLKDGRIDLTGASWIVNTFDEYAIETALRLLENGESNARLGRPGDELVVVTIGPEDAAKELRTCLAMGADRAIHVVAKDEEIDALVVVKVLASIVAAEKPDLVILGKQAVDGDANQVGQMLAGKLAWPQATFAASLEQQDGSFLVGREVDGGVEYKRVPTPSVITVDLRIVGSHSVKNGVTPPTFAYQGEGARLPSLKGIMAAKKKPMTVAKLGDYGAEPVAAIKEVNVTLPPPRAAGQIVADIPTLVKKLAEEAKVI